MVVPALLYRRNVSDGRWIYNRALLAVTGPFRRAQVRMKDGLAAVQFGDRVWIFEVANGHYVLGRTAAPIRHPGGLAISGNRILIGGNGCDYDAVVYQKGTDGSWGITGRLDDNQGECRPEGMAVELNDDYAILKAPSTHGITAWRRDGTAVDWVRAGSLTMPPGTFASERPMALQGATAVAPGSPVVFRRSGTTWTPTSQLMPVDHANGTGTTFDTRFRDGVLVTAESWWNFGYSRPYAYVETSPGEFEHVAIMTTRYSTREHDVSGRTVVAVTQDWNNQRHIELFDLPVSLVAPPAIVNDFEDRDLSEFTFQSGQFALAARGSDDVLTRTDTNGIGIALLNDSEWSDYQRVEAHVTSSSLGAGGWVGVVARHVDADNYYYVAVRNDNAFALHRRYKGVDTMLLENFNPISLPARVVLVADGDRIYALINNLYSGDVRDDALPRGRAGLATFQTRADFDDVLVASTEKLSLMEKDWFSYGYDFGRPFTEIGGDWRAIEDEWGTPLGFSQVDVRGAAFAVIGTPVRNQEIVSVARVDAFGSSTQGAWLGLLARYVDARTHYYVTVRSTNQIQIRKQVDGVITVLASASFTAVPGRNYHFVFQVINDQLALYVDRTLVATARDDAIASGQYGIATYRSTATWQSVAALQP
jgi:hypothetical protein